MMMKGSENGGGEAENGHGRQEELDGKNRALFMSGGDGVHSEG